MSDQKQSLSLQQALDLAVQHHDAGRLGEAEKICQQILQYEANFPAALHLLGLISHQMGKDDEAADLITRAVTLDPEMAVAHSNLGIVQQSLARPDDAAASFRTALRLAPDYAPAHYNLGNTLRQLGKPEEAAASYREALDLAPNYVEAHHNLGAVFQELGKLEEAAASYRKALALQPNMPEGHYNLGNALQRLGNAQEAVASYQKALALHPDYADAHNGLGLAFGALERPGEAFTAHRRAVALAPQNGGFWSNFAASLENVSFDTADDDLYRDLLRVLDLPTVRPADVARPILSALRQHPDFAQIVAANGSGEPNNEIAYDDVAERLSAIPLFLRLLELSPLRDLEIERMLTALRRALLQETTASAGEENVTAFSAALALHCFTNEYVFPETEAEIKAVETLHRQVATLLENGQDVPPTFVVALGAYRPLFAFPWAQKLSERNWPDTLTSVITRQIVEPLEERSLRAQIPSITGIENAVSQSVREQYEENPYPRWINTGIADKGQAIGEALTGPPFNLDLGRYVSPDSPAILIAGCGTGQQALNTATKYSNAHVLAVDLSRSSLAYAQRKTAELGVSNIDYAQADIMALGEFDRQFDLIESVGVLHHLGDPLAGWRILVDLLRPGGLMRIGLYSEIARQHIVAGRAMIAEQGYAASADDIRRCRQDIIAMAADGDATMAKILQTSAFFSLSHCRDLLFHVQEHRFSVPQIEDALRALGLEFLGFEFPNQRVLRQFKQANADSDVLTSLALWHRFELDNPETFNAMYQFWCRKL